MCAVFIPTLFGCAPYINSYYLPESEDGHRSGHSTLTSDAPIWILERGGATFKFSAIQGSDSETNFILNIQPIHLPGEISLSAKVREETRAKVLPISVNLENIKSGVAVVSGSSTERIDHIQIVKGKYGTNNRHSVGLVDNDYRVDVDEYLELSAALRSAKGNTYIVEWPPITINRKKVELPPIKYLWKQGVQIQYING
jgi:hypothetical protein